MSAEYATLDGRIRAAEARMATFRPTQVNTYLESWATEAGVSDSLSKVSETGKRELDD